MHLLSDGLVIPSIHCLLLSVFVTVSACVISCTLFIGMGLRLVGGVMCSHSNEVHARIVCTKKRKEGETVPDQVAILNGKYI